MKSESEVTQSCPIFCNPWTVACQAPPSMGFSKQEYWNGLPFPSPGDLPDQGIEPKSPIFWEDSLSAEPQGKPIYTYTYILTYFFSWWWLSGKECRRCGDTGSGPEVEDPLEEGNGNPLQYSCLGNLMDRGAWRATVRGVAKCQTQLSE